MNDTLLDKENGSLPKIDLKDSLDNTPQDKISEVFTLCYRKLCTEGKLSFSCIDIDCFCKDYIFSNTKTNTDVLLNLQSITPLANVIELLQQNRLKVISLSRNNNRYYIEVMK